MRRGEIWTVAGGGRYTGKPRPALILQDDFFDNTDSLTVCAFTTDPEPAFLIRIPVEPSPTNGLERPSWIVVDKITTVPRTRLGKRVGLLDDTPMAAVEGAILAFLGIAGSGEPNPQADESSTA